MFHHARDAARIEPEFRTYVGDTVNFDHNGSKVDMDELTESKKFRQISQIKTFIKQG